MWISQKKEAMAALLKERILMHNDARITSKLMNTLAFLINQRRGVIGPSMLH